MRSLIIILILFVGVIVIAALYLLSAIGRFKVTFDLFSIELKTLQLSDFVDNKGFVRIGSKICIVNPNSFGIKFSSLYYEVFYKNEIVIKSSEINENLQNVNIGSNKTTCFITKSDVFINPKSLELVYKAKSGEKVDLTYTVYFKLFFLRLSKTGTLQR